jgi:Spy/CpxP family protein refolding chaperone
MISRTIKGKVLVFAVFFIGIASGVLIANFYEQHVAGSRRDSERDERAERARNNVKRFNEYLGLTEQQQQEVSKIMEGTRSEFRKLSQETQPKYRAIEEASRDQIRALLTEEQKAKYDEFRARRNSGRGGRGDGRDRNRDRGDDEKRNP